MSFIRNIQTRLQSFKKWVHAHPKRVFATAAIGLVVGAGLTVSALTMQRPEDLAVAIANHVIEKKPVYYSPLTGETVADETLMTKPTTAVMIENSPDARPQSGLKDAEVVYEAVAEGGITRFLALYQQNEPELVGPVRSLRMYYVDWLTPYDASIAHVGGSYKALKTVRNGSYKDIDQFFNAGTYWRATDRYAPHNVYTNFKRLNELNKRKGFTASNPKQFERQDDPESPDKLDAASVSIDISGPTYNPSYTYDPKTKRYLRSQAGEPHLDREAGQISAKVVIALKVNMTSVMEDGYRESIQTVGSGEAVIFQNGHASTVTWSKDSVNDVLQFTGQDGQPFKLARGTTWISAVPNRGGNVAWQ